MSMLMSLGEQPVLNALATTTASLDIYSGYSYLRTAPFQLYQISAPGVAHSMRTMSAPRQVGVQENLGVATP